MSFRLLEVVVPSDQSEAVQDVVEASGPEKDVLDVWHLELGHDLALVRVLVPQEATEAAMDALTERFGEVEGFRMILVPVEAVVPRPVEETPEELEKTNEERPKRMGWIRRISREELYQDVEGMSHLNEVFLVLVVLATVVASIGLVRDNVAVVIGSMVIAPLLGPMMGLSLATTLGDRALAARALRAGFAGLALALAVSFLIGLTVPVNALTPEIASRTVVGYADVALGLAVGFVGALSVTTRVATTLVGVMVAVALLPPLVVVGLLAGEGQLLLARQAGLLLAIYVIAINLAGVLTFLVQGVLPQGYWAAGKARRRSIVVTLVWLALLGALAALIRLAR